MEVGLVMSPAVQTAHPDQTIRDAANMMRAEDVGALPVSENDRLIGVITDRDIAVRAVAADKPPSTPVREVMTGEVKYCFEDEDADSVARNMAEQQIRRLPVVSREKRLVGILSLGDLATRGAPRPASLALQGISQPTGSSEVPQTEG
jgi:CBS domain-containing protein